MSDHAKEKDFLVFNEVKHPTSQLTCLLGYAGFPLPEA
jgi:hypothetical protein